MDTSSLETKEGRLEEGLRSTEPTYNLVRHRVMSQIENLPFVANRNHLSIGELVALF